ncbi:MAG: hypothetical protein ABI867_16850 [Kofleriaceae bacterium]
MTILNITYQGQSADYELDVDATTSDADIQRIAVEVVRSGSVHGLHVPQLPMNAFHAYVVDRINSHGEQRIYLRPKVPFGARA